jgi:hypothetical protein
MWLIYNIIILQATIRPPVVKNMEKALWFQFTVGSLPLYAVIFMGYWAYGSSTSGYLLNSVTGPVWVKAVANLSAFFQTVIALHVSQHLCFVLVQTTIFSPIYTSFKHAIDGCGLVTNLGFMYSPDIC